MKKKTFIQKILYVFAAFIFSMFYVVGVNVTSVSASGMTVGYSDVLTDLKKDKSFKVSDYPEYTYEEITTKKKKLLEVISIAESEEAELFLYVYNPTRKYLDITACEVLMYCEYAANPTEFHPQAYDLKLVSKYSVFDKYLVEDFSVSDKADRYYNIVEISRPFDENIDMSITGGTTENKAITVAKQWYCHYYNDELFYEMGEFNVLEITPTFTGNFKCYDGITWGNLVGIDEALNAHFIAFNCENYVIEHICDADLTYKTRTVYEYSNYITGNTTLSYGNYSDFIPVTLKDTDKVEYKGKGLFAKTVEWSRISPASQFVYDYEAQGYTLSDEAKKKLSASQWVFCFAETKYEKVNNLYADPFGTIQVTGLHENYYQVGKVDILRISFLDVNQKYYNLGVVSDKVTADITDDGVAGGIDKDWWNDFLADLISSLSTILFAVIIGFAVIMCLPTVATFVGKLFAAIIKWLLGLLCLPFKLISKLFKK